MRKIFILLSTVFIGGTSLAQNSVNSPFSSYGLGEVGGLDHAAFSGIGNTTITSCDSTVFNFYNPASYNSMANGQPIFSLGVSSRLSNFTEGSREEFGTATGIQHFGLGLQFAKYFGLGFGLKPYSRRGYEFNSGAVVNGDSLTYNYKGSGGINEVFMGFSTDILNFENTRLAVGGNAGFLFGNSTNTRTSYLHTSTGEPAGGINTKTLDVRSFHYTLGAYFQHSFNPSHSIGLYATLDPQQTLTGDFVDELYYSANVNNPGVFDTLQIITREDGELKTAPETTFGASYKWTQTNLEKSMHPELALHLSYGTTDWSRFENTYDPDTTTFLNTSRFTFGVQFTPEAVKKLNATKVKFFKSVHYRAGFYTYSLPYTIGGEQVKDFGTTFGFGIPVVVQKSLSSINFGVSIGRRGVSDKQLLNENYYGINFGITIAPGFSERWFRKQKLN